MNILIPDGTDSHAFYRSVLAMTRTLGRQHRVYIGATNTRFYRLQRLLKSRYCASIIPIHSPDDDVLRFVEDVNAAAARFNIGLLLPYSDQIAAACAFYQGALKLPVPQPDYTTFARAMDKQAAIDLAIEQGIPVPLTIASENLGQISAWMSAHALTYPIIVKPKQRGGHVGTRVARSPAELESLIATFTALGDAPPLRRHRQPLVQELIRGELHDCNVLYEHGTLKAMLTQVRKRQQHTPCGAATMFVTTAVDEIKAHTKRLMDALRWHGPAQAEWIHDRKDGQYKLLEINPRFWGSVELSIEAGINFPDLAVQLLRPGTVAECFEYAVGVRLRWAFPEELLSVLDDRGYRWARLKEFLSVRDLFDQQTHFGVDVSDIRPDLFRLAQGVTTVSRFVAARSWKWARNSPD